MKRKAWKIQKSAPWSPEGYWASYSDLMAGILLVFAIASVGSVLYFTNEALKPTKVLRDWREAVQSLQKEMQGKKVKIDPVNGCLIISEDSLRYALNSTKLSEDGKNLLRDVVPVYLQLIQQKPEFASRLHSIEISGHTDSTGKVQANNYIGSVRASNVLTFLMNEPELAPFAHILRTKAFSAGYADTVVPAGAEFVKPGNWPEARRIEIQIHFDDSSILSELTRILDSLMKSRK